MENLICALFLTICGCSLAKVSVSRENDVTVAHAQFDVQQFDDVMATYMRERRIPGASVAVSRGGQFLIRKGYGRASAQRLMTPWALMRIGSVSKIVTAVAVLKLVEEETLRLDSKVFGKTGLLSEYGPAADSGDERINDVTVLDLLQHTAGWDQRTVGDPLFMTQELLLQQQQQQPSTSTNRLQRTIEQSRRIKDAILRYMMNRTLQYQPGTQYSYSNVGYTVLGRIVERVSGRQYETYVRDLLKRADIWRMKLAAGQHMPPDVSEVEYFYRDRDDPSANVISELLRSAPTSQHSSSSSSSSETFNVAALDSSCGWISTASDVVRLVDSLSAALSSPRSPSGSSSSSHISSPLLLKPDMVRLMLARPSYSASAQSGSTWYGLGVVVEDNGRTFWHSGTLDGSTSVVAHDGQTGLTWAALLNCRLEPTSDLGEFMRYAVRQVYPVAGGRLADIVTSSTSTLTSSSVTSPTPALWQQQQQDGGGGNRNLNRLPEAVDVGSSNEIDRDVSSADDGAMTSPASAAARLVDAMSRDGRTAVKLMVADYRVQQLVAALATFNYRPTWIDACDYRGHVFFNVIWTRNDDNLRWRVYFDLSPQRYRKRFRARVVRGYRLAHVDSYVGQRRMRYAAIFVRGDKWPDWTAYEGVSAQRHRSEFYRHLRDGYQLNVQSVTEYQGQLYVAAIYTKSSPSGDWRVRLGLSPTDFAVELERQLAAGRVLSYAEAYEQRGSVRFSAVWTPRTSRHWAASHALSKYTLLNKLIDYAAINVPLVCVTAYVDDDGGLYFAALWR